MKIFKKTALMVLPLVLILCVVLTACDSNDSTPPDTGNEPTNVRVSIEDDEGCFSYSVFTVEKGTILDKSLYENVVKVSNWGNNAYFIGKWTTSDGKPFDFDKPLTSDVTIKPNITEIYSSEPATSTMTPELLANDELKENKDMKIVTFPEKDPYHGNSTATLKGSGVNGAIFEGFNNIEAAVIPEYINHIYGAIFYNCEGIKEIYFEDYGYYMRDTISRFFMDGCNNLEHIYFDDEESLQDFREMLVDLIEELNEDGMATDNIERFENILSIKQAPSMNWDNDRGIYD